MASIGDIPFYSTSPVPLQTGLGYREQALKNQGQETLNQGYELNNEYKVQQTREATRLNDEAQRQLDKSADLRAAYAQSTTHQPIGQTQPVAQPQQPPIGTSTAQQSSAQSIGGLNFGQNLPNLNTPVSQLIGQKPAQPAPGAGASPYGTTGPLKQTQVVPTLAEQTGIAPLVAAHPSANSTLDQGAVGRGEHSAFQTFTQPGPNGQSYQTTVDRNKLLQIYGTQHPEDVEPLKAQFAAMDAKQAKDQTEAEWQHHVGIASDFYGIKLLEDNPTMAAKAWDSAYAKHAANGENMNGIPTQYPGKEIFDKMNDQMLSATDRASEAAKAAAQTEKQIHDQEAEKQRKFTNQIALQRLGLEQQKLAAELAKVNLPVGGVSGESFRAQLDPNMASTLDGISLGEVKLPARGGVTTNAILAAKRLNPDVNMTEAQKITEELGRNAPNTYGGVQFFGNKAAEHLAATQGIDAKLPSADTNLLGIGKAYNATVGTLGGNPNVGAWNTTHTALVDELKKSLKGAPGGELEALRDLNNLKWNDTPDKKKAVYAATAKLLLGNDAAAMEGRKQAFGHLDSGDSFLSGTSLDVLGRTLQANGDIQPLPSPAGTHKRASTQAAMGNPAGASEPKTSTPTPTGPSANDLLKMLRNQ